MIALRLRWLRRRAAAMRWSEELELVQEEMARVKQFLGWEREEWLNAATLRIGSADTALLDGLTAYAQEQIDIRQHRERYFDWLW